MLPGDHRVTGKQRAPARFRLLSRKVLILTGEPDLGKRFSVDGVGKLAHGPVFVNMKFYWHTATSIHLHMACPAFMPLTVELLSFNEIM